MPLDAFCLAAVVDELQMLVGGKVDKIVQPSETEIQMAVRSERENFKLLISCNPSAARLHLTNVARENPYAPPMFCMLLRKHFLGARIMRITQAPCERVVTITFDTFDEIGVRNEKSVVCELMGRHSNIIIVGTDNRIMECVKRVDLQMSEERPVLPGLLYCFPPTQRKRNPLDLSENDFATMLKLKPENMATDDYLLSELGGMSPLVCREVANAPDVTTAFFELMSRVKSRSFTPCIIYENDKPKDYTYTPINQYSGIVRAEIFDGSFSQMLDQFYTSRDILNSLQQKAKDYHKSAQNQKAKLIRKMELQRAELEPARNRERLRQVGDLLMANLHRAERGASEIEVEDFYDDNKSAKIPLDSKKSLQQNAAKAYKDYSKAKNAEILLTKQLEIGAQELEYWESVLEEISRVSTEKDLLEIKEELSFSPKQAKSKQKNKEKPAMPIAFKSSEGIRFYAGRNNKQNDHLTLKMADKNDIWLHTQKIPGCHVVIDTSGERPSEQTLYEAACIAALYSQASASPKVNVDYTKVKNVKKPAGAKPGMVIYNDFKTIFAVPDKDLAERLKTK